MSDEMNAPQPPGTAEPGAPTGKGGFLSTPGGRIVAIVVGLGVLAVVAGIAVAVVLFVFGGQAAEQIADEVGQQVTGGSTTTTGTVVAQAEAPANEVANAEVFTFRDIFVPLIKPLPVAQAPGSTTTSTTPDTVTPTTKNTLYLDGVVTQDGVLMAQLRYNDNSYTLGAGGVIPNSPWQVLRVSSTSVTMLYGDIQVSLSIGQGRAK